MYKRYNTKLFKTIQGEPFETQNLSDGTVVKMYSLNAQPNYQAYLAKNMYYSWACRNNEYIMAIDDEYYASFKELFSAEANILFINHLNRLLKINFINKVISYSLLGATLVFLIISLILNMTEVADLGTASLWVVVGCLVVTLGISFFFRKPQQKSLETYRREMRELFGEQGIEDLVGRQNEFYASKVQSPVAPEEPTNEEENKEPEQIETNEENVVDAEPAKEEDTAVLEQHDNKDSETDSKDGEEVKK